MFTNLKVVDQHPDMERRKKVILSMHRCTSKLDLRGPAQNMLPLWKSRIFFYEDDFTFSEIWQHAYIQQMLIVKE